MDLLSQLPRLCTDEATKGFDLSSGDKWIYPENYPVRDYQFKIVNSSLFHNTLVCLPTGLGKTFIAAVVMYNYWRWYPEGVIVFLAPTKPLVAQQIDACHDIMGIPISETIELTGAINQKQREIAWRKKRVIFATPQTFQKDLEKGIIPTVLVKCVVIDEAHKALGKHAYSESVRLLNESNRYYRLLALSATPGSNLNAVQDVIRNLGITRLELRDDTSPDIIPYINERKLDIIQVQPGDSIMKYHERYIEIMDPHLRVLLNNHLLRGQSCNISKGRIFLIRKELMARRGRPNNFGIIMQALTVLLTMCHANELMLNHGLRAFYNFYQNHADKYWINNELNLLTLLDEIKEDIGSFPDVAAIIDGSVTDIPADIKFSHDKFLKLREILTKHFNAAKDNDTRAIVFVEYRDIVNEVFVLLLQLKPLIRPQIFVGQAGQKQKQQKLALDLFRKNEVNVLISTSVGEEGLDVGEVDLIVCFDIQQNSPTRLVQRMGRTGRKRDGHIIVLVTDGKEYQTLKSALAKRDSLNTKVLQSSGVITALGNNDPRMVPDNLNPEPLKMHMTVIPVTQRTRKKQTKELKKLTIADKNKLINAKVVKKKIKTNGTLMKFLANNNDNDKNDCDIVSMHVEEIPTGQLSTQKKNNNCRIKSSNVKLLTSDSHAVEFLTLCTIQQSEKELIKDDCCNILYMPIICHNNDFSFDTVIPPLSILDCLTALSEYVPPLVEEINEINVHDEGDVWEPSDYHQQILGNTRELESICTEGRFEDLCDTSDETDSDATNFESPEDQKLQQITMLNGSKFTQSIVGAFEDILEDTDDDSVVEIPLQPQNNINPVKLTNDCHNGTPQEYLFSQESLVLGKCQNNNPVNMAVNKMAADEEEVMIIAANNAEVNIKDVNSVGEKKIKDDNMDLVNIDFCDDFGFSDTVKTNKSTEIIVTPCKNFKSQTNSSPIAAVVVDTTKDVKTPQSTKRVSTECLRSPDLTKSSQRRFRAKLNMSIHVPQCSTPIVTAPCNSTANFEQIIDSEEDIFDIDSLTDDPSIEMPLKPVNTVLNNTKKNSNTLESPMDTIENISTVVNNICDGQTDNNGEIKDNVKEGLVDDIDINFDDYAWSSDFDDTTSNPIIESKYFENKSKNISIPSAGCAVTLKNSPGPSRINQKENQPSKSPNLASKLMSMRPTLSTKSRLNLQPDSDSDDGAFGPEIITKNIFRRRENNSNDKRFNTSGNRLVFAKDNGTKKLPEYNLARFAAPKKSAMPRHKTPAESKRTMEKRSTSLDEYQKKKKPASSRYNNIRKNFIDDEAEVSTNDNDSMGSDDEDDDDDDLGGFVSHSQYHDNGDMRAHYLQSVRSPRRPGKFLIRKPRSPPPNLQIYSQAIPDEPNTYLQDSFCVGSDEETPEDIVSDEFSILEEVERKLKKKSKRKRSNSADCPRKRKRIVQLDNSSSEEDEAERMRAQIAEESMLLKNS